MSTSGKLCTVVLVLLVIGGLNWLLVGLFQFDFIAWICGGYNSVIARIIYIIVGLAAIYAIFFMPKLWRNQKITPR